MPLEPWRPALDLALHRNRKSPQHRFVQLATAGLDGRPAVRTVVFRGFVGEFRGLAFTTDARSAKRAQIERDPNVELCWYFAETREQFRLSGVVRLVGPSTQDDVLRSARLGVWRALSAETGASFTWPPPGQPRDRKGRFPSTLSDPGTPVDEFVLMLFSARSVDHLELDGAPQHRWKYTADALGRWSVCEVNP